MSKPAHHIAYLAALMHSIALSVCSFIASTADNFTCKGIQLIQPT